MFSIQNHYQAGTCPLNVIIPWLIKLQTHCFTLEVYTRSIPGRVLLESKPLRCQAYGRVGSEPPDFRWHRSECLELIGHHLSRVNRISKLSGSSISLTSLARRLLCLTMETIFCRSVALPCMGLSEILFLWMIRNGIHPLQFDLGFFPRPVLSGEREFTTA